VSAQNVKELARLLSNSYTDLSPNFLKIADFILTNPEDIALLSMRNIADRLDLDPSNFVRFAKFLSFSGYPQLRALFQEDLRQTRLEYSERAEHLQSRGKQGKIDGLLSGLQRANATNLEYVFEQNSPEILEHTAQTLMAAEHIFVMGMRSCFPAAFELHYICRMVRRNVTLSSGQGGTFADDIRGIGASDVFVVIGMHPYTTNTITAANYAAKNGARIVALTDSVLSPLAAHAEKLLVFDRRGSLIPGTILPIMALVEALTAVMIANGGQPALDAIKNAEEQLREFSAYSFDNKTEMS
jgi:DNA-binding MurR/RpiR family transcriptional regulator